MSKHIHHDGVIFLWSNEIVHSPEVSSICRMPGEYCLFWQQSIAILYHRALVEGTTKKIPQKFLPQLPVLVYFLCIVSTFLRFKFITVCIWHKYDWVRQTVTRASKLILHSVWSHTNSFNLNWEALLKCSEWMKGVLTRTVAFASLSVVLRVRAQHYYRRLLRAPWCFQAELSWAEPILTEHLAARAAQLSHPCVTNGSPGKRVSFTLTAARVKALFLSETFRLLSFLKYDHTILQLESSGVWWWWSFFGLSPFLSSYFFPARSAWCFWIEDFCD